MSAADKAREALAVSIAEMKKGNQHAIPSVAVAQVHATLALVEEQRTANLIAMFGVDNNDAAHFRRAGFSYPDAAAEIQKALGLS